MGTRVWPRCQLPTGLLSVDCIASLDGQTVTNGLQTGPGLSLGLRGQWWVLNTYSGLCRLSTLLSQHQTMAAVFTMTDVRLALTLPLSTPQGWGYHLPKTHILQSMCRAPTLTGLAAPWVLLGDLMCVGNLCSFPHGHLESPHIWLGFALHSSRW